MFVWRTEQTAILLLNAINELISVLMIRSLSLRYEPTINDRMSMDVLSTSIVMKMRGEKLSATDCGTVPPGFKEILLSNVRDLSILSYKKD